MLPKDQLNPINDTLANFQFRHVVAANSRYNASLWCYVHPMKGKLEFGVQQGPSESFYATLLEAIEAYNNLER